MFLFHHLFVRTGLIDQQLIVAPGLHVDASGVSSMNDFDRTSFAQ